MAFPYFLVASAVIISMLSTAAVHASPGCSHIPEGEFRNSCYVSLEQAFFELLDYSTWSWIFNIALVTITGTVIYFALQCRLQMLNAQRDLAKKQDELMTLDDDYNYFGVGR